MWLASVDPSTLEWIERGPRRYAVISSTYATSTNGVPSAGTSYQVVFEEHDTLVTVSQGFSASREAVLALADSVQRVDEATFRALAERSTVQWRKAAYFVPDVVPEGFAARAWETRELIGVQVTTADLSRGVSVQWSRTQPSPDRVVTTVPVGDRTVEVRTYATATHGPGMRAAAWHRAPDLWVVGTGMAGNESDEELVAVVGGMREVSEAEWKVFLGANGPGG
jgi:hypothetical protein